MPARILIIEDNPTNMELMVYLLNAFGHTPLPAYDGEEGVKAARTQQPELILCDVHLPKLDGYATVHYLKNDQALARIPIIAVTALSMVGDREKLLSAGFDGYIGKPIDPEIFVGQVEKFLRTDLQAADAPCIAEDVVDPPKPDPPPLKACLGECKRREQDGYHTDRR